MKVTEKDVLYVADLANLELTPEERARMVRDLNSILEYVDRLNELDTAGVPPMAQVSDRYGAAEKKGTARFEYAMRADVLGPSLDHKVALANAPDSDGTFFKVPKVIER
ncbi:MAG TPA: Asp-tRNA(Asn)/Glu-tRNA(Gln) amidotransferase subunit GatC [Terriglobales bacterium]|nr:Asp-tRNA(Asn)/Glu-tRNA(Gln) amidotransferase subunit GatC [Terriglobales bacterium]